MRFVSNKFVWIPLYVYLIYCLIKKHRAKAKFAIPYMLLAVIWADQVSSSVLKPTFKRLRPSHVKEFQDWIHTPDGPGGLYGFCSSHAANSFAIALAFYLVTKNKLAGFSLFVWAILISYSRVYLGVHYPIDVLTGAFVGIIGSLGLKLFVYDKLVKNV